MASWQSSRITTQAAAILLREKLGYKVEVLDFSEQATSSYQADAWNRLKVGSVDLNLELWPQSLPCANASLENEVLASASDLGKTGYVGRAGWFIPIASLREAREDVDSPRSIDPWRALLTFPAVEASMANWTRLPPPAASCAAKPNDDGSDVPGAYDCEHGEWRSPTADCCSAAESAAGACAPGLPPCAVLSVVSPAYDVGKNEAAAAGSGLRLQIQYGMSPSEAAQLAEATPLPILSYNWEPNPKLISRGRFLRVRLTDPLYCNPYAAAAAAAVGEPDTDGRTNCHVERKSNIEEPNPAACDFAIQELKKLMRTELQSLESAAFRLVAQFRISFEQISRMMGNASLADALPGLDTRSPLAPTALVRPAEGAGVGSTDDDFNRACGFLRAVPPECTASDAGCWHRWIEPITDASQPQELPFLTYFMSAAGYRGIDRALMAVITIFVVLAAYVFGRGDDGYTSGNARCNLPDLLRALRRGVVGHATGSASPQERGVPVLQRPSVIRRFARPAFRGSSSSRRSDAVGDGKADAKADGFGPPSREAASASLAPVLAHTSVSLGRSLIVVSAADPYVAVPLLRIDSPEGVARVLVQTTDGREGNGGRLGRDYGAVHVEGAAADDDAHPASEQAAVLSFPPKARLRYAYVDLLPRARAVACGEHDCAEFVVALSHAPSPRDAGGSLVAIGPVKECVVRILKPSGWPTSLGPLASHQSSHHHAQHHATHGHRPTLFGFDMHRSSRSLDMHRSSRTSVSLGRAVDSLADSLGRAVSDLALGDVGVLTGGGAVTTKAKRDDVVARVRLSRAFLKQVFCIDGLTLKVVRHQVASFLLAFQESFLEPLFYSYVVFFGVEARRPDMALLIAFVMMSLVLVTYHIKLNYFHGSMLVMQHMRAALCRKYLSFTREDHLAWPSLHQEFRVAIQDTAEEVRSDFWKGIFHSGLPELYKIVWSITYLVCFHQVFSAFAVAATLVVFVFLWYGRRTVTGAHIARREFELSRKAESKLEYLILGWQSIQQSDSVLGATQSVFDGYWAYLRQGAYVMWYHRFYTEWFYTLLRFLCLYLVWGVSWSFRGQASTFVALNKALSSLGGSLQDVAESLIGVLISTSKIEEIGRLLNAPTAEKQLASVERACRRPKHVQLATELDGIILKWQVNAADAEATTRLIAETRALSFLGDVDGDAADADADAAARRVRHVKGAVDEMTDLMACWATLLDQDATDDGGSFLVYNVSYTPPQVMLGLAEEGAPPATSIFENLCVSDHTSSSVVQSRESAATTCAALKCPVRLPAGVFIGLRTTSGLGGYVSEADDRAMFTLIEMFRGQLRPSTGIARCTVKVCTIDADADSFVPGSTLYENLVLDAECRITGRLPELQDVWSLCKLVGMSEHLIGARFGAVDGWERRLVHVSSPSILHDDLVRITLVRALLSRPNALLVQIDRVGASWTLGHQRELCRVLRNYLDGSLADLTHRRATADRTGDPAAAHCEVPPTKSRQTRPSVVLTGASELVLSQLLQEEDVVLSIESKSAASLTKAKDAFPAAAAVLSEWIEGAERTFLSRQGADAVGASSVAAAHGSDGGRLAGGARDEGGEPVALIPTDVQVDVSRRAAAAGSARVRVAAELMDESSVATPAVHGGEPGGNSQHDSAERQQSA